MIDHAHFPVIRSGPSGTGLKCELTTVYLIYGLVTNLTWEAVNHSVECHVLRLALGVIHGFDSKSYLIVVIAL